MKKSWSNPTQAKQLPSLALADLLFPQPTPQFQHHTTD